MLSLKIEAKPSGGQTLAFRGNRQHLQRAVQPVWVRLPSTTSFEHGSRFIDRGFTHLPATICDREAGRVSSDIRDTLVVVLVSFISPLPLLREGLYLLRLCLV